MSQHLAIFDCEGTLTDSAALVVASLQNAFVQHCDFSPPHEAIRTLIGKDLTAIIAQLLTPEQCDDKARILQIAQSYHQFLEEHRSQESFRETLFPGIIPLLHLLAQHGVLLAIITAKSRNGLDYTLSHNGIKSLFTITHTANDGVRKPDAAILKQTLRECATAPHHCVMIGDSSYDIEMAINGGVIPIGVCWGGHSSAQLMQSGAQWVADDPTQIGDYLENLWQL